MKETTFLALQSLKNALEEDPRLLALKEIDAELERSTEILRLSCCAKEAAESYGNALSFGDSSPEAIAAQKKLYEAKKALDEHPLSRRYASIYREVRVLYAELDHLLFSPYRLEEGKKGCPHA